MIPCYFVDNKCSGCGQCCGSILPLSGADIKRLRRFIKKRRITLQQPSALIRVNFWDTCPFLDPNKDKERCIVYPARPEICRLYNCYDKRHGKMTGDYKKYKPYDMWQLVCEIQKEL